MNVTQRARVAAASVLIADVALNPNSDSVRRTVNFDADLGEGGADDERLHLGASCSMQQAVTAAIF